MRTRRKYLVTFDHAAGRIVAAKEVHRDPRGRISHTACELPSPRARVNVDMIAACVLACVGTFMLVTIAMGG